MTRPVPQDPGPPDSSPGNSAAPAPSAAAPQIHASGTRAIAAKAIGVAITGDHARVVVLPAEAALSARETQVPPGTGNLPGPPSATFTGRDDTLTLLRSLFTTPARLPEPAHPPAEHTTAPDPAHLAPSHPGSPAATHPITDLRATNSPATNSPATNSPATNSPATNSPTTTLPATDVPAADLLTSVATRTVAIHGLGGIGKSTVALHYASGYRAAYPLVWWITATAPAAIEAGLASLAVRLAPLWAREATTEERVAWSLTWLQWHPGWLLVLDNVENPADLRPYLGALSGGHALATSRRATGWHTVGAALPLGPLAPAASTDLLCALAYTGRTPAPAERHAAAALADELGHLPLALEQAGSYVHQTGKDMDAYRRGLRRMLAKRTDAIDPERTVARIWEHTLRAVTARDPLAVSILNTVAWLAPDDIPRDLLSPLALAPAYDLDSPEAGRLGLPGVPDYPGRPGVPDRPGSPGHPVTPDGDLDGPDPDALDEAVGVLHAYTMVTLTQGGGLRVHRLVQAALRARLVAEADRARTTASGPVRPDGLTAAEWLLHDAVPEGEGVAPTATERQSRLLPHVTALATHTPPHHLTNTSVDLFVTAADHLYRAGLFAPALPLREVILAYRERTEGAEDPATLTSRHNLAFGLAGAGDFPRARALYETTLEQRTRILGADHPDTLMTCNALASVYEDTDDLDRAIELYEETLSKRERVLGDLDSSTIVVRNNLAGAYVAAGDQERGTRLYETVLTQCRQALGDTHPYTLSARSNLAYAYRRGGELTRAADLLESLLSDSDQVLGALHPDTLDTRAGLARVHELSGDVEQAARMLTDLLPLYERVLGDAHPSTGRARAALDRLRAAQP
ncbi:tetratricopeptide repeat protein [Streptomyces uncialis]|uniref:tetratricopeptide repeat protein n=1 Tax=Streptomyces uncialis TaxID=1048205 RepID=UPI00380315F6